MRKYTKASQLSLHGEIDDFGDYVSQMRQKLTDWSGEDWNEPSSTLVREIREQFLGYQFNSKLPEIQIRSAFNEYLKNL